MKFQILFITLCVAVWGACGSAQAAKPLATPLPLQKIETKSEAQKAVQTEYQVEQEGQLVLRGKISLEDRGTSLNLATSLYRILKEMGVDTEVTCAVSPTPVNNKKHKVVAEVKIVFQRALSLSQYAQVRKVLNILHTLPLAKDQRELTALNRAD